MLKLIQKRTKYSVLLIAMMQFFFGEVKGQCTPNERVYATTQSSTAKATITVITTITLSEVTNQALAIDNNVNTYSTLNTYLSALGIAPARQTLTFPTTSNGSVPVSVKLGMGSTVASVLNVVKVQATLAGVPVGVELSGSSLLGLLGGQGESIVTFTPGSNYDGVRVSIDPGVVSIGASVNLYYAYYEKAGTINQACSTPIETLTGSTSGIAGVLNGVTNPSFATDGNTAGSPAEIRQNVGAAGYVYLTAIYPSVSVAGDLISITMSVPGSSLLDASVFSKLSVVASLGNTDVATMPANALLLGVRLLDATNHIYNFTYAVNSSFDRISIRAGGLVSALSSVDVYEISRVIPNPVILIDGANIPSQSFCVGQNTTLSINTTQACTIYNWYNAPSSGTLVNTGTSYPRNGLAVGTYNYYVEAVRQGCTSTVSERTLVTITVNPKAQATDISAPGTTICSGLQTTLTATCSNVTILSPSFKWYDNAALTGVPLSLTANLTITPTTTTSYWVTVEGTATCQNASNSAKQVTVIVTPHPPPPITITSN